jgi:hypothetical protein
MFVSEPYSKPHLYRYLRYLTCHEILKLTSVAGPGLFGNTQIRLLVFRYEPISTFFCTLALYLKTITAKNCQAKVIKVRIRTLIKLFPDPDKSLSDLQH